MSRFTLIRIGLILTFALSLAACGGAPPATTWPGLATTDQLVLVAAGSQLHTIQFSDGKPGPWTFPAAANNDIGEVYAAPGVSADMIVVAVDGPASSYSGALFGLNPADGQTEWCLAFDAKALKRLAASNCRSIKTMSDSFFQASTDNRVVGGITLTDTVAYFGLVNGEIYAVDALAGAVKWTAHAQHAIWSQPLVTAEAVYITSLDHHVYALNRDTGALLWEKDMGAALAGTPLIDQDTLYLGTFGNAVYALAAATGETRWSVPTNKWVWDSPVIQAGVLYFTDVGGAVYAVDLATHTQKWSTTPGGAMRAGPVVTGQAVYVVDRKSQVFALNLDTGQLIWPEPKTSKKGELLTTPLVISNTLILASYRGDNLVITYPLDGASAGWVFTPSK